MPNSETNDLEVLVRRVRDGDASATEELIRHTQDFLMRLAYGLLGDFHSAQDLLQEAYVIGLSRLQQLNDPAQFRSWLARILSRLCYKFLSRNRAYPTDEPDLPTAGGDPADRAALRLDLRAALAGLTALEREVIVLRDMLGLPYEEMAQILSIPVGTVRSRLSAARKRMEKLWNP